MKESPESSDLAQRFNPLTHQFDIVPTERYVRAMTDRAVAHRFVIDQGVSFVGDKRIVHLATIDDRTIYVYSEVIDEIIIDDVPPVVIESMMLFDERASSVLVQAPIVVCRQYPSADVSPSHECMLEFNYGSAILYRLMKQGFNFLTTML